MSCLDCEKIKKGIGALARHLKDVKKKEGATLALGVVRTVKDKRRYPRPKKDIINA